MRIRNNSDEAHFEAVGLAMEPWRLTMEPWRLAQSLGGSVRQCCEFAHFDDNLDPHQREKSDLDPHQSEKSDSLPRL